MTDTHTVQYHNLVKVTFYYDSCFNSSFALSANKKLITHFNYFARLASLRKLFYKNYIYLPYQIVHAVFSKSIII